MIPPQQSPELSGSPEDWLPVVYEELRRLARDQMRQEATPQTLQTTALVHEAYLRLIGSGATDWSNRGHFFGAAARAMRRILVDRARARKADKRGGGQVFMTLDEEVAVPVASPEAVIELDRALDRLDALSTRQRQVVEMRFFGGMTHEEVASVLGVSVPTVRRDWRLAQAWLKREMTGGPSRTAAA